MDDISIERQVSGICVYADAYSDNGELSLRLKETARADQQMAEKNDALQREYDSHGIKYYILQDEGQTKIIWANGTFECRVFKSSSYRAKNNTSPVSHTASTLDGGGSSLNRSALRGIEE